VRGPGRPNTRRRRRRVRGHRAHLRRAGRPRQPARPAPGRARRGPGHAGRRLPRTRARPGARPAGGADDRRRAPAARPGPAPRPEDPIYVIYTSGSTGRPKGVVVTHANVLRLFTTTERQFGFGAADTWTLFHSYAFDFSVWELWGALLYGGRLVVVPRELVRDPDRFLDLLVERRVTVLNQTPSAFRQLVAYAADGDARIDRLALRAVVFGGEKLEIGELTPWIRRLGTARPRLINM